MKELKNTSKIRKINSDKNVIMKEGGEEKFLMSEKVKNIQLKLYIQLKTGSNKMEEMRDELKEF